MTGRHRRTVRGSAAVAALVLLGAWLVVQGCTSIRFLRAWHKTVGLPEYLKRAVGPTAVSCGVFQVQHGLPLELTPEQFASVATCFAAAQARKAPFFYYVEGPGVDSVFAKGLVSTSAGEVSTFLYDSSPCGGRHCGDRFHLWPCNVTATSPLEPGLSCKPS